MKTITEWLQELPVEIRARAIKNTPENNLNEYTETLMGAVSCAFDWRGSQEGISYWDAVSKKDYGSRYVHSVNLEGLKGFNGHNDPSGETVQPIFSMGENGEIKQMGYIKKGETIAEDMEDFVTKAMEPYLPPYVHNENDRIKNELIENMNYIPSNEVFSKYDQSTVYSSNDIHNLSDPSKISPSGDELVLEKIRTLAPILKINKGLYDDLHKAVDKKLQELIEKL